MQKLKRAGHHYWPESVSAFWADDEGQVTRLSSNGERKRAPPKNWGVLGDGHRAKHGGLWDYTIEPLFESVDSDFRYVIEYLLSLKPIEGRRSRSLDKRLVGHEIPAEWRRKIGECVASLVVRSPAFRNTMKLTADWGRDGLPYKDKNDEKNLIIANMDREYRQIVKSIGSGGKLVLMFSKGSEFIFGEGFLHNLGESSIGNSKFLVPLTPTLTVGFISPLAYMTKPNALSINLSPTEVATCNEITQVYSKDYIFFRAQEPKIVPGFSCGEFRIYQYNEHPRIDELLRAAVNFRS